MFVKDLPDLTLERFLGSLTEHTEALSATGSDIVTDFSGAEDVIRIGQREVPGSWDSVEVLCQWLSIPKSFLRRLDLGLRQDLLNRLAAQQHEPVIVRVSDTGLIRSISTPMQKTIEHSRLVEVAIKVIGPKAIVTDFERDALSIRFDTIVAADADYGIGGDPAVNDITRGGLRWGHESKANVVQAPWVQDYMMRLICTNGTEMFDPGLKIDARGGTVESVLAELEAVAERAFSRVEREIEHFYELRNRPVDNPERLIGRSAIEDKLSERMRHRLLDRVPVVLGHAEEGITEFDVVNLITNAANDPELARGAARRLQQFGGTMVRSEVDRCTRCASKLTA